ncbi:hypothetical protein RND71_042412 [Anisodus tanguticus]|uniref:Alpha/beta hydrolase fold-3 domain-containing protein n=1 Tax=Anisodus tanguticus TaxID=243964 RepID=A0AAE1QQL3_9SOLA|nr:hypothetical protein RND71_042412 [Anisodus tanguticus]
MSTTMSDQNHQAMPIDPNVDPYGYVGMVRHSDGSIPRILERYVPVDTLGCSLVVTKDIAINSSKNTWARVILPRRVLNFTTTISTAKLSLCRRQILAVVVSIEYCQAHKHRLPTAYEDCMKALHWIKNKPDELLADYTDFSKCFLMGTSAGGNIAYNLGLCAAACWDNLKPLEIKGLILNQPFFGGK